MCRWEVIVDKTMLVEVSADECDYSDNAICFYAKGKNAKEEDPAVVLVAVFSLDRIIGVYKVS